MSYAVAIDIGGTFTDLVAFDHEADKVIYTKSPTTYGNFVEGILDCFRKANIAPEDTLLINHGTTLVINSLIQRLGGRTALITTRGFRDVLEIARGNRPDPLDLYYQRDEPLIPRDMRFEVNERMDSAGKIIQALDADELGKLAERIRKEKVEAVAVFFLNSYANPFHEEEAAAMLKRLLPGVFVTCSTELSREWYEYERTSTVAANAYVGPQVNSYIRALENDLKSKNFDGTIYMMGSNGGVLSVERTCRQPIALVESGPIGGCIGAGVYAQALGFDNVISFDMGGTTAKCTLVEEGRFSVDSVYYASGYVQGFPIKSPVINIVEVGSGGGSIGWVDAQNRLHVGPRSAGSNPGPACYGRGGTEPTVTDANLVLGRLNAENFLGGELKLDSGHARQALATLAAPLGYAGAQGEVELAAGILAIATVVMAGAVRKISVEHGRDPRDFVLFSYGGGGPLHACALAHELSIPVVVIPPEPGNFSAIGMLLADARLDDSNTFTGRMEEGIVEKMESVFTAMEQQAAASLKAEFSCDEVNFQRFAEMRYIGQRHNIRVPVSGLASVMAMREAFEKDYKRRYGHADAKAPAELQALHLSAFARLRRPDANRLPRPMADKPARSRKVCFDPATGSVDARVYDRYSLARGFKGEGPAVIEEYGSTTLVWPGDHFEIGPMHEIRVHCTQG